MIQFRIKRIKKKKKNPDYSLIIWGKQNIPGTVVIVVNMIKTFNYKC